MGQGVVLATPLQIANEAATLARGGIWMRPRLLTSQTQLALDEVNPRPDAMEQVDLKLDPQALEQAHTGMVNVVDGPNGTGKLKHPGFTLAAKTGTAETGKFPYKKGTLKPVYFGEDETDTPWYRTGKKETDKNSKQLRSQLVHGIRSGGKPANRFLRGGRICRWPVAATRQGQSRFRCLRRATAPDTFIPKPLPRQGVQWRFNDNVTHEQFPRSCASDRNTARARLTGKSQKGYGVNRECAYGC